MKNGAHKVGLALAKKLARALGFKDMGAFFFAVGDWWEKKTGRALFHAYDNPLRVDDPELKLAIEMAKGGDVARDVIVSTMDRFKDDIGKRNRFWWIDRMGEQVEVVRARHRAEIVERKAKRAAARKLAKVRADAPESSRALAGTVAPAPAPAKKKRRQKAG